MRNAQPERIGFLFGAGASKGAGSVEPYPPPLGDELYGRLKGEYPHTWGSVSPELDALFPGEFEEGMAAAWYDPGDATRALIIDLAVYFSRFSPSQSETTLYDLLLMNLRSWGRAEGCLFGTLNYDCLLEHAVARILGL